jgi:hypothetical protein
MDMAMVQVAVVVEGTASGLSSTNGNGPLRDAGGPWILEREDEDVQRA